VKIITNGGRREGSKKKANEASRSLMKHPMKRPTERMKGAYTSFTPPFTKSEAGEAMKKTGGVKRSTPVKKGKKLKVPVIRGNKDILARQCLPFSGKKK